MALVVLFSTLSFTIDMHYCGDTLVETSVFKKAKGCGMTMETPTTEGCSVTKKKCCSDEQSIVDGQDELQLSNAQISFEQQVLVAAFIHTYNQLYQGVDLKVSSYEDYAPPLVIRQIFKFDETYLI